MNEYACECPVIPFHHDIKHITTFNWNKISSEMHSMYSVWDVRSDERYAPLPSDSVILTRPSHFVATFPYKDIRQTSPGFRHTRYPSWKLRGQTLELYLRSIIRLHASARSTALSCRLSRVSSSTLNSWLFNYISSIFLLRDGSPNSTGNIVFVPYFRLKGVSPVVLCGVHRYP